MSANQTRSGGVKDAPDRHPARAGAPLVRVIVAGRTDVESSLRHDERIELVRAIDGLEAVGELADPIDEESPSRAVVIVGKDALPEDPASHGELIDALRELDPSVRVLRTPSLPPNDAPYDGTTDAARALEDVLKEDAGPGTGAPIPAPHDDEAKPRVRAQERADFGDERLAGVLLRGEDVLAPALAMIGERLGAAPEGVSFERSGSDEARGARVAWRGHLFGYLRVEGADAHRLERAASWLASWLVLADQREQLERAAFTDPLTGAWNRRYLERFLSRAITRARARRRPVTVLVFDIDDFKLYNDRYGHEAGDEILRETVRLLQSVTRPTDRVCRIGGDEFVVVFDEPAGPRTPGSRPPTSVETIARRFQRQICEHRFPKLAEEAPGTLTISAGLAAFPWDGSTPEEVVCAADHLALASKRQGKNALTVGPGAARVCQTHDSGAGESTSDTGRTEG